MNEGWKVNDTSDEIHVTFMFHCAFVRTEGARRTDVILAPGFTPPAAQTSAEHGNGTGNGMTGQGTDHEPDDHQAPAHAHPMQHIASLRVPAACVLDESQLEGQVQKTTTMGPAGTTVDEDKIWRLEGFDVSIQPDGLGAGTPSTPANFEASAVDGDTTYTLASLTTLSGRKIDRRFAAETVPDLLHRGARVRVWGGTLKCGVPGGLLKHRTWDLGLANPVGLSDRVDYRRTISGGVVSIVFKKFGTSETKTVKLRPRDGVIRMHVTNDPFAEDTPHGSHEKNPCETLPHFLSYAVLLEPAGTVTALTVPPLAPGAPAMGTISEGNTFCCPCGDGVP